MTIASKARSGVKSPVLKGDGSDRVLLQRSTEREKNKRTAREKKGGKMRNKRKRKVFAQLVVSSCGQTIQPAEEDKPQGFHILFLEEPVPGLGN